MRAFVRGFGWFLLSLVVAAVALRATVFDVWTVTEPAFPSLTRGDVVLVLRESKASPGNLARCVGPDGRSTFAMRVPAPLEGQTDPDDLPKAATLVKKSAPPPPETHPNPRNKAQKRARTAPKEARETRPVVPPTPVEAHAGLPAAAPPSETTTCRRVVFRLWGEKGPLDPERRLDFLE